MAEQTLDLRNANTKASQRSLHLLGVLTGFAAGVWMGAAEAPTKFVAAGFSPVLLSLAMVTGVFTGRWTIPTLLKGSGYVFQDLREKRHLIVWALLGGGLWAVNRVSNVEHRQPSGFALGMVLLSRAKGRQCFCIGQSIGRYHFDTYW